jgi:hypothetical protein
VGAVPGSQPGPLVERGDQQAEGPGSDLTHEGPRTIAALCGWLEGWRWPSELAWSASVLVGSVVAAITVMFRPGVDGDGDVDDDGGRDAWRMLDEVRRFAGSLAGEAMESLPGHGDRTVDAVVRIPTRNHPRPAALPGWFDWKAFEKAADPASAAHELARALLFAGFARLVADCQGTVNVGVQITYGPALSYFVQASFWAWVAADEAHNARSVLSFDARRLVAEARGVVSVAESFAADARELWAVQERRALAAAVIAANRGGS